MLSSIIFLPFLGALLLLFVPADKTEAIRRGALAFSLWRDSRIMRE